MQTIAGHRNSNSRTRTYETDVEAVRLFERILEMRGTTATKVDWVTEEAINEMLDSFSVY